MIWLIGFLIVAALVLLELRWDPAALNALRVRAECGTILAQPGEEVEFSARVENPSRLPVTFVRLRAQFPASVQIIGDEKWMQRHFIEGLQFRTVEFKMSLMPLRGTERRVRFSCGSRGAVSAGKCFVSVGDLLGFWETTREFEGQTVVVIPERSRDQKALNAVGGFLGDISVRRFILEDPVLTVGFRDYTGREPLKAISWKRTAATGTMQVKQYDHTAEQTVMVLLNVSGAVGEELEECFRLTRSVCEELERKKIPFGLRTNGNLPTPTGKLFHLAEGLGTSHLDTILYGLGRADDTCYRSFSTLVKQTLKGRRNNEAYIVITPELDARDHAALRELETAGANPVCVLVAGEQEAGT